MWGLVSWLWDRVGRVYAFFGWLYDRIKDAALNAWSWAVDQANKAYNGAVWWAKYYFNWAIAAVDKLKGDTWFWITDTWGRITYQVMQALGTAWGWVQFYYIRARDWAVAKANAVLDFAQALFSQAWQGFIGLLNGLRAVVDALFDQALRWAVDLFQDVQVELAEFKRKVGIDTPEEEATLRMWVTNPIGTLAAFLKGFFMGMLEYSLAYAMGSVKYTLPPWPDFTKDGGYIPPTNGNGPPPGASGLFPPLSSISISGHTFRQGHPGIDLALARDQTVYAMHGGKIRAAYFSLDGYGKMIILDSGEWWTRYAHLSGYLISEGAQVEGGQAIATGNSTGNSTGDHLHLEIKHYGQFIDPVTVL